MQINFHNLFFQSHTKVGQKNEFKALAQSVANIQKNNNAKSDFQKPSLRAIWHNENGKMVCKWIIE
ncbi:hypothetical protein [Brasilonema sp. UFV-L1]|uniref:hypothetical protein n=1 Tax=Brasilonema sp. UFV-L1 TaxID=2234130 RepID=UPI00145C6863|nr:hypothetical protein [Brasilonema sp. UFV-L1]